MLKKLNIKRNSRKSRTLHKLHRSTKAKSHKSHKSHKSLKTSKRSKQHIRHSSHRSKTQHGGSNCLLATVNEPAFSLPDIGGVKGLNIAESRALLYRPNCKTDTYQAMLP